MLKIWARRCVSLQENEMVKVKICGITNLKDALTAQNCGADFLGFVFADSPRRVDPKIAKDIIVELSPDVKIVALFVNEQKKRVLDTIDSLGRVDMLQFHGDETPEYCGCFKDQKIIKAFRIKDERSLEDIKAFCDIDFILLDAFKYGQFGGTGDNFDWNIAAMLKQPNVSIFLSGGLNPDNVKTAVDKVKPFCVDVSSGVEREPGKKDEVLIARFIQNAKSV